MTVTMADVRAALDPDEVDYPAASALGPDALPHLMTLVSGDDPGLAAKAAYLAGTLNAADIVATAATSGDARVRVAAASAASMLPAPEASQVLTALVADGDTGVQKLALRSVPAAASPELRDTVAGLSQADTPLGNMATEALNRIS